MKIISNFKDYYDYLQGIYGQDEKVVYERLCECSNGCEPRTWSKVPNLNFNQEIWPTYHTLAICNVMYRVAIYNSKFYHNEEVDELKPLIKKFNLHHPQLSHMSVAQDFYENTKYFRTPIDRRKTDINTKYNCPIIYIDSYSWLYKNVKLSQFGIGSIYPADKLFEDIYNFITKDPIIVDTRTDIQKLECAGFDKKTSFRNIK